MWFWPLHRKPNDVFQTSLFERKLRMSECDCTNAFWHSKFPREEFCYGSTYFLHGMYPWSFRALNKLVSMEKVPMLIMFSRKGASLVISDAARHIVKSAFLHLVRVLYTIINFICQTDLKTSCPKKMLQTNWQTDRMIPICSLNFFESGGITKFTMLSQITESWKTGHIYLQVLVRSDHLHPN